MIGLVERFNGVVVIGLVGVVIGLVDVVIGLVDVVIEQVIELVGVLAIEQLSEPVIEQLSEPVIEQLNELAIILVIKPLIEPVTLTLIILVKFIVKLAFIALIKHFMKAALVKPKFKFVKQELKPIKQLANFIKLPIKLTKELNSQFTAPYSQFNHFINFTPSNDIQQSYSFMGFSTSISVKPPFTLTIPFP